MKKIFPYLLLNVLVSAITMLAVILIWNVFHPTPASRLTSDNLVPLQTQGINAALPPMSEKTVGFDSAFMPGEIDFEKITLRCVADEPVDLTGWILKDEQDHQFEFPSLTIYPKGAIDIYSRAGVNSSVELFWNSGQAIWSTGEKITLLDSAGNERSTFMIP